MMTDTPTDAMTDGLPGGLWGAPKRARELESRVDALTEQLAEVLAESAMEGEAFALMPCREVISRTVGRLMQSTWKRIDAARTGGAGGGDATNKPRADVARKVI